MRPRQWLRPRLPQWLARCCASNAPPASASRALVDLVRVRDAARGSPSALSAGPSTRKRAPAHPLEWSRSIRLTHNRNGCLPARALSGTTSCQGMKWLKPLPKGIPTARATAAMTEMSRSRRRKRSPLTANRTSLTLPTLPPSRSVIERRAGSHLNRTGTPVPR